VHGVEIALILLAVLIGVALGDVALLRALSRRRQSARGEEPPPEKRP
jgi:hypothetical protein